ncbi:TetR/AcrR family transcriptional regulator [Actinocorallia populi]|uniref:TetR/AcrR family transcriptional regulator n=1 Tax=Actinocorallia populi TaxID=2079200 RepID=UPI000D097C3E|nr:TetR family transcriptional regulator [Actinocorallia populi]
MAASTRRNGKAGRQEKRTRTRNALLDAAQRLWAERGIHGASLDDIAGAAGLTKGAVYSNFTGKADLLFALLERCTTHGEGLGRRWDGDDDEDRLLGQLLVEFWLYGMRDYSAGWRIADWYQCQRAELAERLERDTPPGTEPDGVEPGGEPAGGPGLPAQERAILAMAMELGLALQHLLDPDRMPAGVYDRAMRLVLGQAPTPTR